jgi:hypothetical protein
MADYTPEVVKPGASQFTGMLGDIIVPEFNHLMTGIHWTGAGITLTSPGKFHHLNTAFL